MELVVVGISYKSADVDTRGQLSFTSSIKNNIQEDLYKLGIVESIVLSTCNRSEIIIVSNNSKRDIELVKDILVKYSSSDLLSLVYSFSGLLAIKHLISVAVGLDSLIVGEDEILHQLKSAYESSKENGYCNKTLDLILRECLKFSKAVKSKYRFSENKLSVASLCFSFLNKRYNTLSDKKILLIGTGEMGKLIIKYMKNEDIGSIYLTNRTMNKEKFAEISDKRINVIEYHQRYDFLDKVDIVISATSSLHTVIKSENVKDINPNILIIDLAVPRDVDKKLEKNYEIITMDYFEEIVKGHLLVREEASAKAKEEISAKAIDIQSIIDCSVFDQSIETLNSYKDSVLNHKIDEIKSLGLNKEIEKKVIKIFRSALWDMVSTPIKNIKQCDPYIFENMDRLINLLYGDGSEEDGTGD
ncbi:MAG: glutamyl-tRNA reductase [Anaerorhabdus sp.]